VRDYKTLLIIAGIDKLHNRRETLTVRFFKKQINWQTWQWHNLMATKF